MTTLDDFVLRGVQVVDLDQQLFDPAFLEVQGHQLVALVHATFDLEAGAKIGVDAIVEVFGAVARDDLVQLLAHDADLQVLALDRVEDASGARLDVLSASNELGLFAAHANRVEVAKQILSRGQDAGVVTRRHRRPHSLVDFTLLGEALEDVDTFVTTRLGETAQAEPLTLGVAQQAREQRTELVVHTVRVHDALDELLDALTHLLPEVHHLRRGFTLRKVHHPLIGKVFLRAFELVQRVFSRRHSLIQLGHVERAVFVELASAFPEQLALFGRHAVAIQPVHGFVDEQRPFGP